MFVVVAGDAESLSGKNKKLQSRKQMNRTFSVFPRRETVAARFFCSVAWA